LKKYLILVFLLLRVTFLSSLENTIDSLQQALETAEGEEKVKLLLDLSLELKKNNPEKSLEVANEALEVAKDFDDVELRSNCYSYLGMSYRKLRKFEEAIQADSIALELRKKVKDNLKIAESMHRLGNNYHRLGQYKKALELYDQSYDICFEINEKEFIIKNLRTIGGIYNVSGEYDKAIEKLLLALTFSEENSDIETKAKVLNQIGAIYFRLDELEKALDYFGQALTIYKEINYVSGIASAYNNIAVIHKNFGDYDLALESFFSALEMNEKLGYKKYIAYNLGNIGGVYFSLKRYDEALDYYYQSLRIKKEINEPKELISSYAEIGQIFLMKKDYVKSEDFFQKSLNLSLKIGTKHQASKSFEKLSEIYEEMGNFQKALEYHKKYFIMNDSLFNQEKVATITEIETKYETEKKEQEIVLLTKNNEIQELRLHSQKQIRNLLLILLFLIIIIVAILIIRYKKNKKLNEILQEQKTQLEKSKAEIEDINKNLEDRVEEEVKTRRAQEHKALEQSRLAALGELAAGIAHEINQPLHSIAFALDNLKLAVEDNDADEQYLNRKIELLFKDVERMKRIIDHIRTFSHKQTDIENGLFDVNESITSALQMIREQYTNHGIRIDLNLQEDLPEVMGNFYKFEQVVLVMLSNGRDAVEQMKDNIGREYNGNLSIKTEQHNDTIKVIFADNGVGISDEDQQKIFNPFFTTKEPGKGTGLGLSIAFGIVDEMNGSITVESSINKGTSITISLPLEKKENNL